VRTPGLIFSFDVDMGHSFLAVLLGFSDRLIVCDSFFTVFNDAYCLRVLNVLLESLWV